MMHEWERELRVDCGGGTRKKEAEKFYALYRPCRDLYWRRIDAFAPRMMAAAWAKSARGNCLCRVTVRPEVLP